MKNINILDCTLRDGGYYNNWDFSTNLINDYLRSMPLAGVDYVELGFRSLYKSTFKGACAYTKDEFLDTLKIPKKLKVAVMVNASDLLNFGTKDPIKNTRLLFSHKRNSKVTLVRIAAHHYEIKKILKVINFLKRYGYNVALNIMQIADRSGQEIRSISKDLSKTSLDVLYFADSMGSLNIEKLLNIISNIKSHWHKNLGIHTHDNMSRAAINTNIAINHGVDWIDGTITGMGRGPGNSKTEYLVIEYENILSKKVNIIPLLELIDKHFKPLMDKYKWGTNPFYFLAGMHGIHPTFIQTMLGNNRFSNKDILSSINHLKKSGGKKFNKDLLNPNNKIYVGKFPGKWSPKKDISNKDVLIIGSGPGIKEYKNIIETYIQKNKPYVIALNTQKSINEKLINIRASCNALSLISDRNNFKKLKQTLVLPIGRMSQEIKNFLNSNKVLDFGLEVKQKKFEFKEKYAILPNSLVASYALGIATSGKAKRILLAGFDGYPSDDPRRVEMDEVLSLYRKFSKKTKILSITPTRFKVESVSIYAL
jgi:4-hydroxy 2-oxovalerate aldolase